MWYLTRVFGGLVTSASDMTCAVLYPPNFDSSDVVPGSSILEITQIWATNVDTSRRTVSVWLVASGGSIGDSSKMINAYPVLSNTPTRLFDAGAGNGIVLSEGMEIHAACSVANKIKLDITGRFETPSQGSINL